MVNKPDPAFAAVRKDVKSLDDHVDELKNELKNALDGFDKRLSALEKANAEASPDGLHVRVADLEKLRTALSNHIREWLGDTKWKDHLPALLKD